MPDRSGSLRVHHLLCIPLFRGAGYSDDFSVNMTEKIRDLRARPEQTVRLVCGMDRICEKCPNRQLDESCKSSGGQVVEKDRELLRVLGLKEGAEYTARELFERMADALTEEIFDASCGNCEWYGLGYCSYGRYRESFFL